MVSEKLMYQIHKRLKETFSPFKNIPFGGNSIRFCEDFHQPVQAKYLFKCNEESTPEAFISVDLWINFKEGDWFKSSAKKTMHCLYVYSIKSE